jgi:hypothetical protein
MMLAAGSRSSDAAALDTDAEYFTTEAHYLSLAGLIVASFRGGASLVLVTGDPLANPSALSHALRKIVDSRYTIIGIPCGPDLTADELCRAGHVVTTLPTGGTIGATPDTTDPPSPLFLFDEADRLSDPQLEEVRAVIQQQARPNPVGVLLASQAFLARLDQPPLRNLNEAVGARLRFNEISEDEGIDYLRHRLEMRRNRDEPRRHRTSYRGLVGLGALSSIAIAGWFAFQYANIDTVPSAQSTTGLFRAGVSPVTATPQSLSVPDVPSSATRAAEPDPAALRPAAAPAASTASQPTRMPPTPSAKIEAPAPAIAAPQTTERRSAPSPGSSSADPQLSPAQVAALVARGDAYLSAGDIASARLYYERAADVGNGGAALRLGATFDPAFLAQAGVRGAPGDPARASSWYRRAYELGETAAGEHLKNLDHSSAR